jgi:ribosomal protein L44E
VFLSLSSLLFFRHLEVNNAGHEYCSMLWKEPKAVGKKTWQEPDPRGRNWSQTGRWVAETTLERIKQLNQPDPCTLTSPGRQLERATSSFRGIPRVRPHRREPTVARHVAQRDPSRVCRRAV